MRDWQPLQPQNSPRGRENRVLMDALVDHQTRKTVPVVVVVVVVVVAVPVAFVVVVVAVPAVPVAFVVVVVQILLLISSASYLQPFFYFLRASSFSLSLIFFFDSLSVSKEKKKKSILCKL